MKYNKIAPGKEDTFLMEPNSANFLKSINLLDLETTFKITNLGRRIMLV